MAPEIPQRGGYVLTGNKILACSTARGGGGRFESLKQYFRHLGYSNSVYNSAKNTLVTKHSFFPDKTLIFSR